MIENDDLLIEFLEEIDNYNQEVCEVGREDLAISMQVDDINVFSPFYNIDGRFKVDPINYYGKYKLMEMVENYREFLQNEVNIKAAVREEIDTLMGTLVKKFMLASGDEHPELATVIDNLEEELIEFVKINS